MLKVGIKLNSIYDVDGINHREYPYNVALYEYDGEWGECTGCMKHFKTRGEAIEYAEALANEYDAR